MSLSLAEHAQLNNSETHGAPLRSEAFSAEHLSTHARAVASQDFVRPEWSIGGSFANRLTENAEFLNGAYQEISAAARAGEPVSVDAEWLLDNFYVVEEQLREIREDLPPRFFQELPKLSSGEPRIYLLAVELIAHTDSAIDEDLIQRFVSEYQQVVPLSIGETWAVPIMLRLALVENLRRLAGEMLSTRRWRQLAKSHAEECLSHPPHAWRNLPHVSHTPALLLYLWEEFTRHGPTHAATLANLESHLTERELSPHELRHDDHRRQAANQVTIGNVITSMRLISALDWVVFFERANVAEQILRRDPAGIYSRMDFESRNRYRHALEDLAKRSRRSDLGVAELLIQKAEQASGADSALQRHIGYWLIDQGRAAFERELGYRAKPSAQLVRWMTDHPYTTYFGSLGMMVFSLGLLLVGALVHLHAPAWVIATTLLLGLLPLSELAIHTLNFLITITLPPRLLPKLELRDGVPEELRTVVVIPTLLLNRAEVDQLLARLEVHYLSNPEPQLRFALLTDFTDAHEELSPADEELLQYAVSGVRRLNARYRSTGDAPFLLLHRRRQWNEREGLWMGWERKRGKLMEFNRWLKAAATTSYSTVEGDASWLQRASPSKVKYVITLDSDTQLPLLSARKLIGTLAHPLNQPVFNERTGRVTSGYGVVQPRVGTTLPMAGQTWYTQIFANSPGIDPYASAASDVYQDLFGEGSFTGKGIYEVETFERSLGESFPENRILSHDLIEGCHARVAMAEDIELFDGLPSQYGADARRQHRWVRGDWQIAAWLAPRVPTATGWRDNPLSGLSRWKIFDNLRRSLVPAALCVWLASGWIAYPPIAGLITLLALATLGFPLLAQLAILARQTNSSLAWQDRLRGALRDLQRALLQAGIAIALLPHRAYFMVDAVLRTLYRLSVSGRRLLEWQTAAAVEMQMMSGKQWRPLLEVVAAPLFALLVLATIPRASWSEAFPWLLAWFAAPLIAYLLSWPIVSREEPLGSWQVDELRHYARRTWAFFETYVGEADHWLPPDNVQEYPEEKIAHRISPTNEGLFLLSGLVARDFGYVSLHGLLELWERNLTNWTKLERLNGHFYNWYDTERTMPLAPRYVSTVDSGNLAACFLTMRQGIDDIIHAPLLGEGLCRGLHDTLVLLEDALEQAHRQGDTDMPAAVDPLLVAMRKLKTACASCSTCDLLQWPANWNEWHEAARLMADPLQKLARRGRESSREIVAKGECVMRWAESMHVELHQLLAWLPVAVAGCEPCGAGGKEDVPRLRWSALSAQALDAWRRVWQGLGAQRSLAALARPTVDLTEDLLELQRATEQAPLECRQWVRQLSDAWQQSQVAAGELLGRYRTVGNRVESLALEMNFQFLYNPGRRLFSIGFNVEEGRLDRAHYDMLCSEARLASYLAIAKGDVPPRHWFQLGRPLTRTAGKTALLSWGGTMFEYLMPPLFQPLFDDSLLAHSCRAAIDRQQEYGRQLGIPWGVSESAFAAMAVNGDYHYLSFGLPGLGLKRGLAKDRVVSPYSTMLALEFTPQAAFKNLDLLGQEGGLGAWGFYDAIDYSPERVPAGRRSLIVRCYMAHHQGMSMLAMANLLLAGVVHRRFHAHPLAQASELLLQERMPVVTPRIQPHADEVAPSEPAPVELELVSRRIVGVDTGPPRTHLLSNSRYSVMLTATGTGYSKCQKTAITRWRSDSACDQWGQFLYLRNRTTGYTWSPTYQPTRQAADAYEVIYSIDKAEFRRREGDIESHLEVVVSPENNAEIRSLQLVNHGHHAQEIEITSYVELALIDAAADLAHPAFHKLFVETEYIAEESALLAKRRPRGSEQKPVWGVHVVASDAHTSPVQFETSRAAFIGRGRTLENPVALSSRAPLEGTLGAVLDPIFSLRCTVRLQPRDVVRISFSTAWAETREEALTLADQYHEPRSIQRAFELAWAFQQVQLRHLQIAPLQAHFYQRIASALLYPDRSRRGKPELLQANRQGQAGLWRYGISGDFPIVLVRATEADHIDLVRELLAAHDYWRMNGLAVDLVVLNDHPGSYFDALQDQLVQLFHVKTSKVEGRRVDAFLLRGSQIPRDDHALLEAAATIVFRGAAGTLSQQWDAVSKGIVTRPHVPRSPTRGKIPTMTLASNSPPPWEFFNGVGGFTARGSEYALRLQAHELPPQAWSNVIANSRFGCLITESGGGYTWFENSRENKLTSWSNDALLDTPSEMLYLRDDESGQVWSPWPGGEEEYSSSSEVFHGAGYSRFVGRAREIEHEVTVSLAAEDPIKFVYVRLVNRSARPRRLSLYYGVEWVLGTQREQTQLHIATRYDEATQSLRATNPFHAEYPKQIAFLASLPAPTSYSGDRLELLGRHGGWRQPAALGERRLSNRTGVGLDPGGTLQVEIELPPGAERVAVFLLGAEENEQMANELLAKFHDVATVEAELHRTREKWNELLSRVEVQTPSRQFDYLVNRWLPYQTLSCRMWGRSSLFQSSGAFGFRDQLQDSMAIVYLSPEVAREHLLRAAGHQYEQGDVQHWWHPPLGRGMRTKFSDDLLWLPLATCHYARVTGDTTIWHATAPFLQSPLLAEHEQERYEQPIASEQTGTMFEHCRRAFERSLRFGPRGLPLIGCGDWNDGMNKIGEQGRGESVWMGWFLLVLADDFLPIVEQHDPSLAAMYRTQLEQLRAHLEENAWDGQWYRRAYFDDGTPLGSSHNDECQIDSLAQTWAVLARANPERTTIAMRQMLERLLDRSGRLMKLLAPPFNHTSLDPGYIKGYLPGIRENGGQYTHAAAWTVQALARQGKTEEAFALFDLLNPINHGDTADKVKTYRAEPYVVAADVYGVPPHVGRGGWSWYTGSSAWMFRIALEELLGIHLRGNIVSVKPCLPAAWKQFEFTLRRTNATWHFIVHLDDSSSGQTAAYELHDKPGAFTVELHCAK